MKHPRKRNFYIGIVKFIGFVLVSIVLVLPIILLFLVALSIVDEMSGVLGIAPSWAVTIFRFYFSTLMWAYKIIVNSLVLRFAVLFALSIILLVIFLNFQDYSDDYDEWGDEFKIGVSLAALILASLLCPLILSILHGEPISFSLPPTVTPIAATATPFLPTPVASFSSVTVETQIQPNGTIHNVSKLSLNSLGFGEVILSYPKEINLHDSALVRLSISPDSSVISALTVVTSSVKSKLTPITFTDRIEIYPIMQVDLYGAGFDITSEERSLKIITSDRPTEWIWSIKPTQSGFQSLAIRITVPVKVDGSDETLEYLLKNISANIEVRKATSDWFNELLPIVAPALVAAVFGAIGFYFKNEVEKGYEKKLKQRDDELKALQNAKIKLEEDHQKELERIMFQGKVELELLKIARAQSDFETKSAEAQVEILKTLKAERIQNLRVKNVTDKNELEAKIAEINSRKITKRNILLEIITTFHK